MSLTVAESTCDWNALRNSPGINSGLHQLRAHHSSKLRRIEASLEFPNPGSPGVTLGWAETRVSSPCRVFSRDQTND